MMKPLQVRLFLPIWVLAHTLTFLSSCQSTQRHPDVVMSSEYTPPKWLSEKLIIEPFYVYIPYHGQPHQLDDLAQSQARKKLLQESPSLIWKEAERIILDTTKKHQPKLLPKIKEHMPAVRESVLRQFGQFGYDVIKTYWEQRKIKEKDSKGLPLTQYRYFFLVQFKRQDYDALIRASADEFQKRLSNDEFENYKVVLFYLLSEED